MTNQDLSESNMLVKRMQNRIRENRLVMYVVLGIVTIAGSIILYTHFYWILWCAILYYIISFCHLIRPNCLEELFSFNIVLEVVSDRLDKLIQNFGHSWLEVSWVKFSLLKIFFKDLKRFVDAFFTILIITHLLQNLAFFW